ncbi:MAG: CBS domain-containing protein [Ardenticatenaceae bacterium]
MNQNNWYDRVAELRKEVREDPHGAGSEALRLFEDWLFEQASNLGYRDTRGGMSNFVDYLRSRDALSKSEAARARRFVDVRNCASHRSGLLIGASLAEELLDFIQTLFRRTALHAEQLMTRRPHSVREQDPLLEARDWMLRHGVSQLPVVRKDRMVALLTNRDILALQAAQQKTPVDPATLTVADAMGADSLEKVVFLTPEAPYDEVLAQLHAPHQTAIFVTEHGTPAEPLLGVITISDILPKL